jgi:cellulose synthase operon protein C
MRGTDGGTLHRKWRVNFAGAVPRGILSSAFCLWALGAPFGQVYASPTDVAAAETPQAGTPGYQELAFAFARLAKGDLPSALKYARRARELAPEYEMPTRVLADVLSKSGRLPEALDAINDFAKSHKPSPALLAQRGYIRRKIGDNASAYSDLRNAHESHGLSKEEDRVAATALYEAAMEAANKELDEGRLDDAIKAATTARNLDGKAEAPVQILLEANNRLGRKAAALAEANFFISQNKPSGRLLAARGYLRRSFNDAKGAIADFQGALASAEFDREHAEKLREALSEAKLASLDADMQTAAKALEAGDYPRAIKAARDARAANPRLEAPVLILMTALSKSGQPQAAVEESDNYVKENAPSAALLAQRAYSRRAAGDARGAVSDFEAALAQPALAPAQEKQARLALAEAQRASASGEGYQELEFSFARLSKGDLPGALKYAERARKLAPDYEMPARVIADVLTKSGRLPEALAALDDFAKSHKVSPVLLAQRGYLRRRLGDKAGADQDLRGARQARGLSKEEDAATAAALYELAMESANKELVEGNLEEALKSATAARELNNKAEAPVHIIVEANRGLGRKAAALAEANLFISQNKPSSRLLAARGYLRRSMNDPKGAKADFEAAIAAKDVERDAAEGLGEALSEASGATAYADIEKALRAGDYPRAIEAARAARAANPKSEAPLLLLMSALTRAGQPREAVTEADGYIKENAPGAALLAQRGYSRRAAGDLKGAASDFESALAQPGLDADQEARARRALAEARRPSAAGADGQATTPMAQALNRAYGALAAGDFPLAAQAAREARLLDPKAAAPTLVLMNVLTRQIRKAEALSLATRYLSVNPGNAEVLAQRGFLRRQTRDIGGAIADFSQALKLGLPAKQKPTVADALEEARYFLVADNAFKAAAAKDWPAALRNSRAAEAFARADESIFRLTIEALAALQRTREALEASNALIAKRAAGGPSYAQRAYLRAQLEDNAGASADFAIALRKGGLAPSQRLNVERGLAAARASVHEARGDLASARAELTTFAKAHFADADGWYALGQFEARHERYSEAVAALENSLALERRGEVLLSASYASAYVDRAKESQYFREALDRWSSDPALRDRPATDREIVKVGVVEADSSVRANVVFGGILDRPKRWGGRQAQPSFETVMRFDGRHLPYIFGLETFVGGFWSQDQTRFTEGYSRLGVRLRPFDGINFSVSGEWQHYFTGAAPSNQFALSWAYGYGGFAYSSAVSAGAASALQPPTLSYPVETGWRSLTSLATYGSYRTGEHRYLQNAVGLLGYAYWDASSRMVVGPAAMSVASYDSADLRPFAAGVGPAIVLRGWLGGDAYRAYDRLFTLQMAYIFPFAESRRQGGLTATLGITF